MIDYNSKIDYLICKYLSSKKFEILDEKEWKEVYFCEKKPKDDIQEMMLNGKKAFRFIKNSNIEFNVENIEKCYQIISNENIKLSLEQIDQLNDIVKGFKEDDSSNYAGLVFIEILKKQIFSKYNIEMAKILHNFIQIKHGYVPSIFYHFQTNKIIKLINDNEIEGALFMIKSAYQRTNHFNVKHRLIHFNEIEIIIQRLKNKLIRNFGVTELYVYGSFSRGEENEYSDLDLYIKVEQKFKRKLDNKYFIMSLLEKELGIAVDAKVHDDEYKNSLKPDMVRCLKRII